MMRISCDVHRTSQMCSSSVSCFKNVLYVSHFKVDGLIIITPLSKQTLRLFSGHSIILETILAPFHLSNWLSGPENFIS